MGCREKFTTEQSAPFYAGMDQRLSSRQVILSMNELPRSTIRSFMGAGDQGYLNGATYQFDRHDLDIMSVQEPSQQVVVA